MMNRSGVMRVWMMRAVSSVADESDWFPLGAVCLAFSDAPGSAVQLSTRLAVLVLLPVRSLVPSPLPFPPRAFSA